MKELKWPITQDMVGTKVVFKGHRNGHKHWRFTIGNEYVIQKYKLHNEFGVCDDNGHMPKENYENTFMFEVVSLPTTKMSYYRRFINWLKGV